ncbi:DnaD domain protein [Lysinibacillus telephonicus]|uniref:DnaD domain protein n=1 Tax=Lysinibacillus telephonicus TaxID=1714840 RepID=A0A3S0QYB3_9BACI|nr:DnaD domain protein [Lysinibacillus telephonicus]RTQ96498.1 DnaD domain protein [Lysinibacillus telephonicus]
MAKAKFRMVYTNFWNDPYVSEEMTPEDKYFFLYLLTNEHTTQIGIYGITKKQIAFELGYSIESVNALMQRFIDHHKLIKYNLETREIAIKNWGKYNFNKGGKPVLDCVRSEIKNVKDTSLISYVAASIQNYLIKEIYDSYNDTPTIRGQEKEQQEEEEEEQQQQQDIKLSSNSSQKLFNLFTKRLNKLPCEQLQEDINYFLESYFDEELIVEAFNRVLLDKKIESKERYADGILRNWKLEGITTYQLLVEKESRKQLQYKNKHSKKEVIPEWFYNRNQQNLSEQHQEPIDFEAERQRVLEKLGR